MAENRVKDFISTVDLVQEQMIQKKEIVFFCSFDELAQSH